MSRSPDPGRRHSLSESHFILITNENQQERSCWTCCLKIPQRCWTCIKEFFSKCCCLKKTPVKYKMVVCGETFGAYQQLLDKIQNTGLNLKETNDEEHNITIVFCPLVSRIGTDAEAAMRKVPGGGPVILVFMHYSQEPKHVSSSKVLSSYPNVVLEVNIFYHDRMNGLLMCGQNEDAVCELKEELKKYSRP